MLFIRVWRIMQFVLIQCMRIRVQEIRLHHQVLSSRDRDTVVFINSMIKKIAMKSAISVSCFNSSNDLELFYIKSRALEILTILSNIIDHFVSIVFISVLFLIWSWKHQVIGTKIWETSWDLILTFLSHEV